METKGKSNSKDKINKSIHSEHLHKQKRLQTEPKQPKKLSQSLKSNKRRKYFIKLKVKQKETKNIDNYPYSINIQDIIKEVSSQTYEKQLNLSQQSKAKNIPYSLNKTKENEEHKISHLTNNDSGLYTEIEKKRLNNSGTNTKNKIINQAKETETKEKTDLLKNHKTYQHFNTQITPIPIKSNPFDKYKGGIRESSQIQMTNIYKTQEMTGNVLDYMMIFKQRDAYTLNNQTDYNIKSQYTEPSRAIKIKIDLLPKKSEEDKNNNDSEEKDYKEGNKYKSFLPRNIGEVFINRKNKIIESILGTNEYEQIFCTNYKIQDINEIEEDDPFSEQDYSKEGQYSEVSSNHNKPTSIKHNIQFDSKTQKNLNYLAKFKAIEDKLKSSKLSS